MKYQVESTEPALFRARAVPAPGHGPRHEIWRIGWLTAANLDAVVADATALGRGTRVELDVKSADARGQTLALRRLSEQLRRRGMTLRIEAAEQPSLPRGAHRRRSAA